LKEEPGQKKKKKREFTSQILGQVMLPPASSSF
jgi:hypothetical protein